MSARPLIVMALRGESEGLVEAAGFTVIYTGLGKINAAYGLTKTLAEAKARGVAYSYVLNLGSAGSHDFTRGALVEADRFVQRDMDVQGLGFPLGVTPLDDTPATFETPRRFPHLPNAICGTGDSFLQGSSPIPCGLVDMEAYAYAKVCALEGVAFTCVKYVTDGADDTSHTDWQKHVTDAPHAFAALLKDYCS
ncbi:MAG TPA: 5'-nucleosidase [Verrucomicrobiae bacterium]|jgi:adenosylhomocysteine nucleosidase|nr:5'-nucleosidase [Verrucomicrobiae bacterium]